MRCQISLYEFYHFYLILYVIMTGSVIRKKAVMGRFFRFTWLHLPGRILPANVEAYLFPKNQHVGCGFKNVIFVFKPLRHVLSLIIIFSAFRDTYKMINTKYFHIEMGRMRISILGQHHSVPNLPYSLWYELYDYLKLAIRLPKRSTMKQWISAPTTINDH